MNRPQVKRYAGAFVVAWHQKNRNPTVCHFHQRRHRHFDQRWRHAAAIKQVACVDEQVNFTPQSGRERKIEIVKEIVPSPPSFHPGLKRQVKTQMSVSDEQDTKRGLAH